MRQWTPTQSGTTASPFNIIRHCIACAAIVVLLSAMGSAALVRGHAVSERIALREQENFSAYGSLSSEASR